MYSELTGVMWWRKSPLSAPAPAWRPFINKRIDAFLGILRLQIAHHHLAGVCVSLVQWQFGLVLEGLFAYRQRQW